MNDAGYMRLALEEARRADKEGEIPIGAVVVYRDMVIAAGHNRREATNDPTSHAEIEAIRSAARFLARWRLTDCTLYVTIEPCPMCAGAILAARMGTVVYGAANPFYGAMGSVFSVGNAGALNHKVEVRRGILEEECGHLMDEFFRTHRDS